MEIHMTNSGVAVGIAPDGSKLMVITDNQSGIKVMVSLPVESARKVASALNGIEVVKNIHNIERGG